MVRRPKYWIRVRGDFASYWLYTRRNWEVSRRTLRRRGIRYAAGRLR